LSALGWAFRHAGEQLRTLQPGWSAHLGSHLRGQCRPNAGGEAVRAGKRFPAGDLRHVVDQGGSRARLLASLFRVNAQRESNALSAIRLGSASISVSTSCLAAGVLPACKNASADSLFASFVSGGHLRQGIKTETARRKFQSENRERTTDPPTQPDRARDAKTDRLTWGSDSSSLIIDHPSWLEDPRSEPVA
jgi:hypothetical protein